MRWAMVLLSVACAREADDCNRVWTPQSDREDLRTCNSTRIGVAAYDGQRNFEACMRSMGYRQVCQ